MPEVKKWTARELLVKTMPFIWAKLLLRLIVVGIVTVLVAIGIWMITRGNSPVGLFLIIAAIIAYPMICFVLNRGVGYFVRIGHIAVLTEMIKTGAAPADGMVAHSKNMVTNRIGTVATFFIIDKAVDGAVNQLMRHLERTGSLLSNIPGAKQLMVFVKAATKKALKYVDECCIAWIFYGPAEQSSFKGACDGIVIYFQNWKRILGGAVVTALIFLALQWGIGFIIFLMLAASLGNPGGLWFIFFVIILAFVALAVKQAYLDSWAMIKMVHTYMEVAPATEIRFDMYNQLSGLSSSFAGLFGRIPKDELSGVPAGGGAPVAPGVSGMPAAQGIAAAPRTPGTPPAGPAARAPAALGNIFCGECGAKNPAGTKFCGDCGKPV